MKLSRIAPLFAALALLAAAPLPVRADGAPATGLKAELLSNIDDVASKLNDLVTATPPEKFAYRPEDGVRSTAEVFLHVSGGNYMFPGMFGVKAPDKLRLPPEARVRIW